MDNNWNKLHVVSLSKVNKRMLNKKYQPNSRLMVWVPLHRRGVTSFAYKINICHERSSHDKGKKRNTKNLWKITVLILLHFTVSNKLPWCSCFDAVYLIQWWKFILFFLGRRVRRTRIFLTWWLIWSLLPPSSSGEAPFLVIQLWF